MTKNKQTAAPGFNNDDCGFFYRPQVIIWILRIFYVICGLLVLADFFVHRHVETDIEKLPAFYAVYGFVACVILVWLAAKMRIWVMREEKYYERQEEMDGQGTDVQGIDGSEIDRQEINGKLVKTPEKGSGS